MSIVKIHEKKLRIFLKLNLLLEYENDNDDEKKSTQIRLEGSSGKVEN